MEVIDVLMSIMTYGSGRSLFPGGEQYVNVGLIDKHYFSAIKGFSRVTTFGRHWFKGTMI